MISKAIIEMSKFSNVKTELKNGIYVVDRLLAIQCPQNYGFIPSTLAEDGDALDVFVCAPDPMHSGTEVDIEIIGQFICEDQGVPDNKLISIVKDEDYTFDLKAIHDYLANYKEGFKVLSFKSPFTLIVLVMFFVFSVIKASSDDTEVTNIGTGTMRARSCKPHLWRLQLNGLWLDDSAIDTLKSKAHIRCKKCNSTPGELVS